MANSVNWFEIPAANYDRAVQFYSQVMGADLHSNELAGVQMAFFPTSDGDVGGAVCHGDGYEPSSSGSLVYLNGGEDLSTPLGRVEKAGGAVVMPKTKISDEIGFIAMFTDTEGNRVAFHSPH